jgi:uncharacterized protein
LQSARSDIAPNVPLILHAILEDYALPWDGHHGIARWARLLENELRLAATWTGVRLMERALTAIPGSRLEIVQDSFDPTNLCQPQQFNRLLASSLDQIGW